MQSHARPILLTYKIKDLDKIADYDHKGPFPAVNIIYQKFFLTDMT